MKPELPLPSDRIFRGVVIASTWLRDGWTANEVTHFDAEAPEFLALVLLLKSSPPHYTVAQLASDGGPWTIATSEDFPNINPAVDDYAQEGGDH